MNNKIYLILLFLSVISNSVFGQEATIKPTGQIKDIVSGLCITQPPTLYAEVTLQTCNSSLSSQQFTVQMGIEDISNSSASHTFKNGQGCLYSNNDQDKVIWNGCSSSSFNEWSFRYTKSGFRIINRRFVTQKKCMTRDTTDNTIKLVTCSPTSGLWILPTAYQSPIFDPNYIPETTGFILDSSEGNRRFYPGWSRTSGKFVIKFDTDCTIKVTKGGYIQWANRIMGPSGCTSTAIMAFQLDGNLCVYLDETTNVANWCSYSQSRGGKILNFLPRGSYGKSWQLAITTKGGKVVWSVAGSSIMLDSSYNLVPGSYLDALDPTNNKLYAGGSCLYGQRNQLCLTSAGKLTFTEKRSIYEGNPTERFLWDSFKYGSHALYSDTYLIIGTDGSVCIKRTSVTSTVWCAQHTAGLNIRYLNILNREGPTNNDLPNYILGLQDEMLDIKWGVFSTNPNAFNQFGYTETLGQQRTTNIGGWESKQQNGGLSINTRPQTGATLDGYRRPENCAEIVNRWDGFDKFGFYCVGNSTSYFTFSPKTGFPVTNLNYMCIIEGLPEIILANIQGQMIDQLTL